MFLTDARGHDGLCATRAVSAPLTSPLAFSATSTTGMTIAVICRLSDASALQEHTAKPDGEFQPHQHVNLEPIRAGRPGRDIPCARRPAWSAFAAALTPAAPATPPAPRAAAAARRWRCSPSAPSSDCARLPYVIVFAGLVADGSWTRRHGGRASEGVCAAARVRVRRRRARRIRRRAITAALVAVGLALEAAFLNAAFGLCLGCELDLFAFRLTQRPYVGHAMTAPSVP